MNSIPAPESRLHSGAQSTVETEGHNSPGPSTGPQQDDTSSRQTTGRRRPRRTQGWEYLARAFLPTHPLQQAQQFSSDRQEVELNERSLDSDHILMNIQQKVLNYLSKGDRYAIESPAQLAKIIIDFCTSVFDQDKVSAEFQFFDFFEHSVDEVVSENSSWVVGDQGLPKLRLTARTIVEFRARTLWRIRNVRCSVSSR